MKTYLPGLLRVLGITGVIILTVLLEEHNKVLLSEPSSLSQWSTQHVASCYFPAIDKPINCIQKVHKQEILPSLGNLLLQ